MPFITAYCPTCRKVHASVGFGGHGGGSGHHGGGLWPPGASIYQGSWRWRSAHHPYDYPIGYTPSSIDPSAPYGFASGRYPVTPASYAAWLMLFPAWGQQASNLRAAGIDLASLYATYPIGATAPEVPADPRWVCRDPIVLAVKRYARGRSATITSLFAPLVPWTRLADALCP